MGKGEQWPLLQMTKIPLRWWRWIKQVNIILLTQIIRGAANRPSHLQVAWGTLPKSSVLPAEGSYFKCWLLLRKVTRRKKGQTRIFQLWLNRRKKSHSFTTQAPLTHLTNKISKASQLVIYANIFTSTEHIAIKVKPNTANTFLLTNIFYKRQQHSTLQDPDLTRCIPPSFRQAPARYCLFPQKQE